MNRCDRPRLTEPIKSRLSEKNLDKDLSLVSTRPQTVNNLQSAFASSGRAKVISISTVTIRSEAALRKQTTHNAWRGWGASSRGIAAQRESARVPRIVRLYHRINTRPLVETPHGLGLVHKTEVERLDGLHN